MIDMIDIVIWYKYKNKVLWRFGTCVALCFETITREYFYDTQYVSDSNQSGMSGLNPSSLKTRLDWKEQIGNVRIYKVRCDNCDQKGRIGTIRQRKQRINNWKSEVDNSPSPKSVQMGWVGLSEALQAGLSQKLLLKALKVKLENDQKVMKIEKEVEEFRRLWWTLYNYTLQHCKVNIAIKTDI